MSQTTIERKFYFADNPEPDTEKEPVRSGKHVQSQGVRRKSMDRPLAGSKDGKKIQLTFFDIGLMDKKFRTDGRER